jgi:hypothetical protein
LDKEFLNNKLKQIKMSVKVEIIVLPKRANKDDSEYFELNIVGKAEKSDMRHIIQQLDNALYQ